MKFCVGVVLFGGYLSVVPLNIKRSEITKWLMRKFVRGTDSRSVGCCTLVGKVGTIEIRICLFTMVTTVTKVGWVGTVKVGEG
jgi:hypothetical protein